MRQPHTLEGTGGRGHFVSLKIYQLTIIFVARLVDRRMGSFIMGVDQDKKDEGKLAIIDYSFKT